MKTFLYIIVLMATLLVSVPVVLAAEIGSINPEYLEDLALESIYAIAPVIVQLHGGSVEYVWGERTLEIWVRYGKCAAEISVDHIVCDHDSHCFKVLNKWMKGVSKKEFSKAFAKACAKAEAERKAERRGRYQKPQGVR